MSTKTRVFSPASPSLQIAKQNKLGTNTYVLCKPCVKKHKKISKNKQIAKIFSFQPLKFLVWKKCFASNTLKKKCQQNLQQFLANFLRCSVSFVTHHGSLHDECPRFFLSPCSVQRSMLWRILPRVRGREGRRRL